MADIEILRSELGNGWSIVVEYDPGKDLVEWTLRTVSDTSLRARVTPLDAQVLMQMRDSAP